MNTHINNICYFLPNDNPYRDIGRIAVLNYKISELDHYTNTLPIEDFWDVCFSGQHKRPLAYVTTQLQFILSLEEEYDRELAKPLGPCSSTHLMILPQLEKRNDALAVEYRDYNAISELQRRINIWNKENNQRVTDFNAACCGVGAYSIPTNVLLIKHILEKRLERELAKAERGGQYSYGAIAAPSYYQTPDMYQDFVVIENLKKEIIRLEKDPQVERKFKAVGPSAFAYSVYNATKIQDLQNHLKRELAKPKMTSHCF